MKYLINLFPAPEKNTTDKIIYFAFHYLRYILVITQFVAICVFFFRFKVDQDIVDLKEKANQKQSIIVATSDLLSRVQEVDKKMKQVTVLLDEQEAFQSEFTYIYSKLTQDILLSDFQLSSEGIVLKGLSSSITPVKSMYEDLQKEKRFKNIELSNIEKTEEGFVFNMSLSAFTL
ncbi:hypothetical protein CO051_07160 [Candidatus Roizmanbacteria bacterium CG_4_9_14_0_2_um_filter_39_13]|uniref:Fimbrial assembly protein n=2 Tax=Candidatus Roizmaniibacteriota TaxID=1752723 RepID=A0A2M8EWB1_9BACT|nr:MAG: hypothetical protein COY15_03695 [Candidatus Roizmanbacteria bacterium CG_4_10_14_0_2_um_filter_39_12]PJC30155.1 MAG: hypothetical protein CO051_07160 [Candidatus Roizmanbacteria bacterium CG_4_9_14_0_2_um_filter_39_13]PJE61787.1 MAG: hypothetical protein COU87_02730 [Candidatus Roizmanbacteria bacterium CG10_big_fil_rev_8_21_14_0_10_39_12]